MRRHCCYTFVMRESVCIAGGKNGSPPLRTTIGATMGDFGCPDAYDTYTEEAESDDDQSNHGSQPAAHPVTQRSKDIGPNEVGNGGGEEGDTLLPVAGMHRVHHPERERGFQDGDAGIGERECTRRHQDVRILDQSEQGCSFLILLRDLGLQYQQLQHYRVKRGDNGEKR